VVDGFGSICEVAERHVSRLQCLGPFSNCPLIMPIRLPALLVATLVAAVPALAADVIAPNANLKADGIPLIPAELAAKLDRYAEFKPVSAVNWHPEKRELVVARRAGNTTQLHLVTAAGAEPKQITSYPDPVRFGTYLAKKPDALLFSRDAGGNEQRQIYRLDLPSATPILLTDERRKNDAGRFTHARDRLLVEITDVDATGRRECNDPVVSAQVRLLRRTSPPVFSSPALDAAGDDCRN